MKVFISYGAAADQVTALRLQALGAVNGLTVYAPPAHTRQSWAASIDPEAEQKLGEAEVILGVIGAGLSEACRQELTASLAMRKTTLVMAESDLAGQLQPDFNGDVIIIDAANPDRTEFELVHYLKSLDAEERAKNALKFLGTLALGLLIFAPQD